jgi:hypothetical protein
MARTPAQTAALEKKALASENKSEGMRMLFEAGYDVATVRELFDVPYGFAYGVATRGGFVTSTPREAKPKAAKAAKPAAKATATKAATKTTAKAATAKAAPRAKAPAKAASKTKASAKA